MATPGTDWPERAGNLADEVADLAATLEAQGLPEDPAGAADDYLQRVQALLAEIRTNGADPPDAATRDSLQALARANGLLRDLYQRNLTDLAEQRSELRQASRGLSGYAATAGPTESRYLNNRG